MTDSIDRIQGDALPDPEDFWLELGPPSAYYGTDAYDRALQEGSLSPDAERIGWPENYRPDPSAQVSEEEALRRAGLAAAADLDLDDVPPEDR